MPRRNGTPGAAMGVPQMNTPQVPPLDFEEEILILPNGAQRAGGPARAMNDAVAHAPRLRRAVGVHPTGQIAAVKERDKTCVIRRQRRGRSQDEENQGESLHVARVPSPLNGCTQEAKNGVSNRRTDPGSVLTPTKRPATRRTRNW